MAGFNGIVGIQWVDGLLKLMKCKLRGGVHLVLDILVELKKTVKKVTIIVEKDSDRHYYNGAITHFSNRVLLLSSYSNLYGEEIS